eukprot:gene4418-14549_t
MPGRTAHVARAMPSSTGPIDINKLSELMAMKPLDDEQRGILEGLAAVFEVPMPTVKNMAFKKKGVLAMTPSEIKTKIETLAAGVEVSYEEARQMMVIQPGLLFDTEKQAGVLKLGIQSICYQLQAPKGEGSRVTCSLGFNCASCNFLTSRANTAIVKLILTNKSVLHGPELHLSIADMAHLAILREPTGRIVGDGETGNPPRM